MVRHLNLSVEVSGSQHSKHRIKPPFKPQFKPQFKPILLSLARASPLKDCVKAGEEVVQQRERLVGLYGLGEFRESDNVGEENSNTARSVDSSSVQMLASMNSWLRVTKCIGGTICSAWVSSVDAMTWGWITSQDSWLTCHATQPSKAMQEVRRHCVPAHPRPAGCKLQARRGSGCCPHRGTSYPWRAMPLPPSPLPLHPPQPTVDKIPCR